MYANVKGIRLSFDMVLPFGVSVFHLLQMQDLFHTTSVSCKPWQEDPPYLLHWDLSIFHWPSCPLKEAWLLGCLLNPSWVEKTCATRGLMCTQVSSVFFPWGWSKNIQNVQGPQYISIPPGHFRVSARPTNRWPSQKPSSEALFLTMPGLTGFFLVVVLAVVAVTSRHKFRARSFAPREENHGTPTCTPSPTSRV